MRILHRISHSFCFVAGRMIFNFFCHFRVEGETALKNLSGPLIIAFNHSSFLDPFIVMAAVSPRLKICPVRFATWYRHYYKFWPFLWLEGSFPVRKGVGLEKALARGVEILSRGGVVGIAPEERRRHRGRPRKPRRGVAFLAVRARAPVLPLYIGGAIGLTPSKFLGRRCRFVVRIGTPIPPPDGNVDLTEFAEQVMREVYRLRV